MQKTVVELVDDVDGSPATETIRFALDSVEYSIDLSGRNAEKLRGDMEKWVKAAQKIGGRRSRKTADGRGPDLKAVREWAASNKIELSSRGRVPQRVIEQYHAAGH
jgi:nucleoid-associated protein Lsr2